MTRSTTRPILFQLYGLMVVVTLALMLGFGSPIGALFSTAKIALPAQLAMGLGVGLAGVLFSRLLMLFRWARAMEGSLKEMVSSFGVTTGQILPLTLLNGFAEELLFRGFLQPYLGLTLTSVVFALPHLPHRWALAPWPFLAFGMGLVFGSLTIASGSIIPATVAHFIINYFNLHDLLRPGPSSRANTE